MSLRFLVTVLTTSVILASSQEIISIQEDTVTHGAVETSNYVFISPKVYWSIFDCESVNFGELVLDDGGSGLYITADTENMSVNLTSINNWGGKISISNKSPINYELNGDQMFNQGEIFFCNTSVTNLIAADWENSGTLVISSLPGINVRESDLTMESSTGSLINSGNIYIENQVYEMTTPLSGGGCFHIFDTSIFSFTSKIPSGPLDNIFVLYGSNSGFYYVPSGATYTIAGFGDSTRIQAQYSTPMKYNYDGGSGIVTINAGGYSDKFIIGLGYDTSKFALWSGGEALVYTGPVPNPIPSKCGKCPSLPVAPTST